MQHLAQGPSRQAAGAAVAAGAAGGAVAAGTAVAADKGHEHLHPRCPNHQCIGRHHHQGLRDTSPCHNDQSGRTIVRPVVIAICKPGPHL